jgi:small-conductance mechanosensitive channel
MKSKLAFLGQFFFFTIWNFLIIEVIHFLIAGVILQPWTRDGCRPLHCPDGPCPDICLPSEPRIVILFFIFLFCSVLFALVQSILIKKSFAPRFVMILVSLVFMLCLYMGLIFLPIIS